MNKIHRSIVLHLLVVTFLTSPVFSLDAKEEPRTKGGVVTIPEVPMVTTSPTATATATGRAIPVCGGAVSVFDSALKQDQVYQSLYGQIVQEMEDSFNRLVKEYGQKISATGGAGTEAGKQLLSEFEARRDEFVKRRNEKLKSLKQYFVERHKIIREAEDAFSKVIVAGNERMNSGRTTREEVVDWVDREFKGIAAGRDEKLRELKATRNQETEQSSGRGLEIHTDKGLSIESGAPEAFELADIQKKYQLKVTMTDSTSGLLVVENASGKEIARASAADGNVFKTLLERVEVALNLNHKGITSSPQQPTASSPQSSETPTKTGPRDVSPELQAKAQAEIAEIEKKYQENPTGSLYEWIVNETHKIWEIDQVHFRQERDVIALEMTQQFDALVEEFGKKVAGKTGEEHAALMREFENKKEQMVGIRDRKIEILKQVYSQRADIFKITNGKYEQLNRDLQEKRISENEFQQKSKSLFSDRDQQLQKAGAEGDRLMQEIR